MKKILLISLVTSTLLFSANTDLNGNNTIIEGDLNVIDANSANNFLAHTYLASLTDATANFIFEGSGNTLSTSNDNVIFSGYSNTLTDSTRNFVSGFGNTLTLAENSQILGDSNTLIDSINNEINGNYNHSEASIYISITGESNNLIAASGVFVFGSNNTISNSFTSFVSGLSNNLDFLDSSFVFGNYNTAQNNSMSNILFGSNYTLDESNFNVILNPNPNTAPVSLTGVSNSVILGAGSLTTSSDVVAIGNMATSYFRRIEGVATPLNDNDAANKIYVDTLINNVQTAITSNTTSITDLQNTVTTLESSTGTVDLTPLNTSITELQTDSAEMSATITELQADSAETSAEIATLQSQQLTMQNDIEDIHQKLGEMTQEYRSGIAAAISLSTPVTIDQNKNFGMAIGYGNFKGTSASSISFAARVKKNATITFGTSLSKTTRASKASLSFSF